jgi:hypothetical protein
MWGWWCQMQDKHVVSHLVLWYGASGHAMSPPAHVWGKGGGGRAGGCGVCAMSPPTRVWARWWWWSHDGHGWVVGMAGHLFRGWMDGLGWAGWVLDELDGCQMGWMGWMGAGWAG